MSDIVERLRSGNITAVFVAAEDAADEIERLRADADALVDWICDVLDYPYGYTVQPPIPEGWRKRIEDYWIKEADSYPDAETIRQGCAIEGGWA